MKLQHLFDFHQMIDVIKLGVAVALRDGVDPAAREGATYTGNNFNIDSIDRDRSLRAAIRALHPDVRGQEDVALRTLMSAGVLHIQELTDDGSLSLAAILKLDEDEQNSADS